jgi:hypothetical protein
LCDRKASKISKQGGGDMAGRRTRLGRASTAAILVLAAIGIVTAPTAAVAAPSAAAPTLAPLPLPATELSSPAVAALEPGRLDVFIRSAAGTLIHQYRPAGGSWTRTLDLGGILRSQPAVASWGPGRLDVFVRGADDALWHRWFSSGTWSGWQPLGGRMSSAPAVASWAPGRLDVFVRGADNALWRKTFASGQGWSGWQPLGGGLTSSPAAVAWGAGRLDVFVRGSGNAAYQRSFTTAGGWTVWTRLGGALTSQPAAASAGVGLIDLVAQGTDGAFWLRRHTPATGWSAWTSLGGRFASGPGATDDGDDLRLAGAAPNGALYEALRSSPASSWTSWNRVDPYLPFRALGTWVDVFDYATVDPATAVPEMRSRGVRVLYLSTARFNGTTDMFDAAEAGQWLDLAHQNGIKVVGWYVPAYGDMARDVRRTVAIARFVSAGGQRFDAVGVDIERLDEVSLSVFNARLVDHLAQVRAQADSMMGAVVPSPFATDPGSRWVGFPWSAVGNQSDVVVPMALWSFRSNTDGSAYSPDQVRAWVLDQTQRARSLSGRPVSVEGGVDDPGIERTPVTADRVSSFVDAVRAGGALGGSHYDYATTAASLWPVLVGLNG